MSTERKVVPGGEDVYKRQDVMTAAFREYAGVELKKKQVKKPSVRKKLQKSVERKACLLYTSRWPLC